MFCIPIEKVSSKNKLIHRSLHVKSYVILGISPWPQCTLNRQQVSIEPKQGIFSKLLYMVYIVQSYHAVS